MTHTYCSCLLKAMKALCYTFEKTHCIFVLIFFRVSYPHNCALFLQSIKDSNILHLNVDSWTFYEDIIGMKVQRKTIPLSIQKESYSVCSHKEGILLAILMLINAKFKAKPPEGFDGESTHLRHKK